jgi:adenine-specific DNA-methyltransferase
MKYMGSKRELLQSINSIIKKHYKSDKAILDLFAGTCGVGMSFRNNYPIYSNDIQLYSKIIADGTINIPPITITREEIKHLLWVHYQENFNYVSKQYNNYLNNSKNFCALSKWSQEDLAEYLVFIKTLPNPSLDTIHNNPEASWIQTLYRAHSIKGDAFPYVQTLYLFGEMYFSIEQCIAIDSLKYSIDKIKNNFPELGNLLLVALIHAFSYISAGTGHFAQFRDLNSLTSVQDVFLYRNRTLWDYFLRKAEELVEASKINVHYQKSKSFTLDYVALLDNSDVMSKVGLVYADPPYSFVHYSRFYHAIEDLCRYDYPEVEHKGRYRKDRHQSPFCIKSKTRKAFESLISRTKALNIPLLISYSNTGMIQLQEIQDIATDQKYNVNVFEIKHKHSTMGRQKDKNRDVTEALIFCY